MKKSFLIIIIISQVLTNLFAQTKNKFVIKETIDKGDYYLIPRSYLSDSVIAIVYQYKYEIKTNPLKRPIDIHWSSECTAGGFHFYITPEQIFLYDTHGTPNPDELYWVIDIKYPQYLKIREGILNKIPSSFINISESCCKDYEYSIRDTAYHDSFVFPPKTWNDSTKKALLESCDILLKLQIDKYFDLINSFIDGKSLKISRPAYKELFLPKPKYFGPEKFFITDYWYIPELHDKIKDSVNK
jgi:hypothetical protein